MATQFKQDNPGCDCCSFQCNECNPVTYITLSIPASTCDAEQVGEPEGIAFCTRNNGTYIFRTVGTLIGKCQWRMSHAGQACYGFGSSKWYQPNTSCSGRSHNMTITFENGTPSGVKITVEIRTGFMIQDALLDRYTTDYYYFFSDTFDTCSDAIGATLPWVSTVAESCAAPEHAGDCPELCNISGATVSLG